MALRVVLIPANTSVVVSLDAPLSSQTAKVGDTVTFTVDQNLVVNNALVIAKDAKGQGHVQDVAPAVYHLFVRKPGTLTVAIDWVTAVDGEKVLLTGAVTSAADFAALQNGYMLSTAVTETATVATALSAGAAIAAVPVAGAFFPMLSMVQIGRGPAASIGPQDELLVLVHYDVHVSSDTAAIQDFAPGFAH